MRSSKYVLHSIVTNEGNSGMYYLYICCTDTGSECAYVRNGAYWIKLEETLVDRRTYTQIIEELKENTNSLYLIY